MKYIWVLKLNLKEDFREEIEDYFLTLNATSISTDINNNSNTHNLKKFITHIIFIYKPNIHIINNYLTNFKINIKEIDLSKRHINSYYKNNNTAAAIRIGILKFTEEKISSTYNINKNIVIPAGVGFGTGHHPTTKGIIYILNKINSCNHIRKNDVIDVGCGSGILGIVMAKLWKKHIELIDIDPLAIKTSKYNAKANLLHRYLSINKGNGLEITKKIKYDIITINILANPILKMSYLINKKLKNKGRVIISGILHSQKFMILNKLRSMGFILEIQYNSNNWSTLLLKKG